MVKSAFIGFLVALAMLLPPILHFVTGPLGPFVGGWVAGSRYGAGGKRALALGLLIGMFMGVPFVVFLATDALLLHWLSPGARAAVGAAALVAVAYASFMAGLGAAIGGRSGKH
ncbi:MAG: DUF5518 domain-containing protein [Chloroflexi bacterium]|nr:DUF5518 domain-containing protein [Chloroflexota bacterium]